MYNLFLFNYIDSSSDLLHNAPEKYQLRFKIVELNSKTTDQLMLLLLLKTHAYRIINFEELDIPVPGEQKKFN